MLEHRGVPWIAETTENGVALYPAAERVAVLLADGDAVRRGGGVEWMGWSVLGVEWEQENVCR